MIKRYMCIHCKKEFEKIPLITPNECSFGYEHKIIRKTAIINRVRADPFIRENQKIPQP